MQYSPPLIKAILIKRYKRFLADVILEDGSETTIHVANTGAMTGCAEPDDILWLLSNDNPKRKYKLSWELTQTPDNHLICVNTARANQLTKIALANHIISELQGYKTISPEVKYGDENSRIDFLLTAPNRPDCYLEVKSCPLLQDGQGFFPDTVTTRGQKHLRELMEMKRLGHRAVLLFAVLHDGINNVKAAGHLDPLYEKLMQQAINCGVEVLAYRATISVNGIELSQNLSIND